MTGKGYREPFMVELYINFLVPQTDPFFGSHSEVRDSECENPSSSHPGSSNRVLRSSFHSVVNNIGKCPQTPDDNHVQNCWRCRSNPRGFHAVSGSPSYTKVATFLIYVSPLPRLRGVWVNNAGIHIELDETRSHRIQM